MAQYRKDTHSYLNDNKTLFEVVMLADQFGNPVSGGNAVGTAVDAFGRLRTSTPLTLFDSFNRYDANDKFITSTVNGANATFQDDTSTIDLNVDGSLNSKCVRETSRVFAYQPGKSLLVLNTFVMDTHTTGLSQRVGYYNDDNGIFLQQNNSGIAFVKRTSISGVATDVPVYKSSWNIDVLDGDGPSGLTLDITKAQIFWMDIEWLGVGSVRCGFVIDGKIVHCHTFHHANTIDSVYMTTAILPIRYEIHNTTAGSAATLKQICSSVISEGGYEFRGIGGYASRGLSLKSVSTSYVPLLSVRLKSTRLDSVAVLRGISATGNASGEYEVALVRGATLTNDSWSNVNDAVELDIAATAYTGGTILGGNVARLTNQAALNLTFAQDLFDLQFQRDPFTSTGITYTLIARTNASAATMTAAFNWIEIT